MKNKGITLVALAVTIVVIIILAGVSLNLILGENGIVSMAKKAKENTELAKVEEETKLNELYTQIATEGGMSGEISGDAIAKINEFKKQIADYIQEAGGVKPEETANAETFGESIKGIVKEVTKNATATADNITEGKTAWVNGELITGNGKDNIFKASDFSLITSNTVSTNGITYTTTQDYNVLYVATSALLVGSYTSNPNGYYVGVTSTGGTCTEIVRKGYAKGMDGISAGSVVSVYSIENVPNGSVLTISSNIDNRYLAGGYAIFGN